MQRQPHEVYLVLPHETLQVTAPLRLSDLSPFAESLRNIAQLPLGLRSEEHFTVTVTG